MKNEQFYVNRSFRIEIIFVEIYFILYSFVRSVENLKLNLDVFVLEIK